LTKALCEHHASPLEDGDVLLDGREAHRVVAADFDDALLRSAQCRASAMARALNVGSNSGAAICTYARSIAEWLDNLGGVA
jgi:hypothetical protein